MGPTHPNYSRAAPSDGAGGLPQAMGTRAGPGDGEEGCPRHSAPTAPSQHPSRASLRLVAAPWLWTPTLVGRWKPPSTTACLACTLGPDTPTWQVGLGSGDPLGQGGLGEGVTGKGVTAEHRRSGSHEVARGTQEPPSALLPHSSPHLLAGRGENPHTAISGAGTLMPGVGAGPPGWFSSSLTVHGHGDRMETCQGSQ